MKKIIISLSLFICATFGYSQPLPDSIKIKYLAAKTDEEKGNCLFSYFSTQLVTDSSTSSNTLALLDWFGKQHDEVGKDYTHVRLSYILTAKGDFPASLNLLFTVLARFEKREDNFGTAQTYRAIGNTYMYAKDYSQAAEYLKKQIPLASADNQKELLSRIYNGVACAYGEGKMSDSGMVYAQKAVNMDAELKNYYQLAISTSTLGENYIAAGQYDIALPFLRRTLEYYQKNKAPSPYMDAYLKNDFAEVFLATKVYDSADYYAHQALRVSIPSDVKDQNMRAYEYLYKSFEQTNKQDSLNKYFRLAMITKDSLFSLEKIKSIQALSFREELRQQEIAAEKLKTEEDRKQNIQFALMALGIITFIIIFLLLSRSFITNTKWIEFFGVVALLIVFEFLNLLLHPFLEEVTHHSPILMLLALVCIAAILVPFHHKAEHWATAKLVAKNKQVRLAAAKKTIEQLEKDNSKRDS
jgi:tetratricopeptide (TPR) repeat protein